MVNRQFFERSSMEVAIDLGLRRLRFSKEGNLHVPEKTKEILIIQTIPYGTESGYEPETTTKGEIKSSVQAAMKTPGSIDMYHTRTGYVLAISTDQEGKYSEVSIHSALPVSGFGNLSPRELSDLLSGPTKLTRNLGIDKEVAQLLHGRPIHDNEFIEITKEKLPGTYKFDSKQISPSALGSFRFMRE